MKIAILGEIQLNTVSKALTYRSFCLSIGFSRGEDLLPGYN